MSDKIIHRQRIIYKKIVDQLWLYSAFLLSELIDKEEHAQESNLLDADGYFFHEKQHIFKRTTLKRKLIDKSIKILLEKEIIETKKGVGNRTMYKISPANYNNLIYPNSNDVIPRDEAHDDLSHHWYIIVFSSLAHKIWLDESILIGALISKRRYYAKAGKLLDGAFYSTNWDLEDYTTFSKKQQSRILDNLDELNLVKVQLINNNTRYFCLNLELIEEYKKYDYTADIDTECPKSNTPESPKGHPSINNPFNKSESPKGHPLEGSKGNGVESPKGNSQKVQKVIPRVSQTDMVEGTIGNTNNNQNTNQSKHTSNNNQSKTMLLLEKYFDNLKTIQEIIEKYDDKKIRAVIDSINSNVRSPSGYILNALEKNYSFDKTTSSNIQESRNNDIFDIYKKDAINKKQKDQLINTWIEENPKEYEVIYNQQLEIHPNLRDLKNNYGIKIHCRVYISEEILHI